MSETDIVRAILDYLELRGIYAYRNNTGASRYTDKHGKERFVRYGCAGAADITGILPNGRRLDIEVKNETGRVSLLQVAYLENMKKNNGCAFVARSIEDVEAELKAAGI